MLKPQSLCQIWCYFRLKKKKTGSVACQLLSIYISLTLIYFILINISKLQNKKFFVYPLKNDVLNNASSNVLIPLRIQDNSVFFWHWKVVVLLSKLFLVKYRVTLHGLFFAVANTVIIQQFSFDTGKSWNCCQNPFRNPDWRTEKVCFMN